MNERLASDSRAERSRIGATIRQIRQIRGMTVDQLARELLVSAAHVRNIELGHKPASQEIVARTAEALDVPQIALVREGYFDREAAEREAEVRRLTRERDDALAQIRSMQDQLKQLRGQFEALRTPEEVA